MCLSHRCSALKVFLVTVSATENGLSPGGKWGSELSQHWSWCEFEVYPSAVDVGARQVHQI